MSVVLVDTGPLVSYVCGELEHHRWVTAQFASIDRPLLTCEAVLVESAYLIKKKKGDVRLIWRFLRRAVVKIEFNLAQEFEAVSELMNRYANVPMDLADACLVRMSELHRDCRVLTLDSDFHIYRRNGRAVIPITIPS